jgi:hypothetical protein
MADAQATRAVLSGLGGAHRRGGYRDPESQAFIESRFSKLNERLIWRMEFETLTSCATSSSSTPSATSGGLTRDL